LQQFLIDAVNGTFFKSPDGKLWHTIFLVDTDDDIAAAPVVDVICKGANGVQDRLRVPVSFVFYTGVFYHPAIDQICDIDW